MLQREPHQRFKIFHEIMSWKVYRILLVSSPYDAWILDRDQPLAERIIHKYRGLNLTKPPRLTRVSSAAEALHELEQEKYELVITMPRLPDMDALALGREIKKKKPDVAVVLLCHTPLPSQECYLQGPLTEGIDRIFIWTGNPDILLAMIKDVEDRMNAPRDTARAGIRVILFVEDSPAYLSSVLPILYRELVVQTQEVIDQGLTEEHRLLVMRARPKILLAQSYEEALELYRKYEPYILGVVSDACFTRGGKPDHHAGSDLLNWIHKAHFDIPLLLMSSDPRNAARAERIPACFVDKNSSALQEEVRSFLEHGVGFGEFVFQTPEGREVARASNLKTFEDALRTIPEDSLHHHCVRNDLSRWLFARAEIELASSIRSLCEDDSQCWATRRAQLAEAIRATRSSRRKGVVINFAPDDFDEFTEFAKIGKGSMGGKARGLAFFSSLLLQNPQFFEKYSGVRITIPQTLILTTEGFDHFVDSNGLRNLAMMGVAAEEVAARFVSGHMPNWMQEQLEAYLDRIRKPLAVRSSGLLEDARFRAYAGLYKTYLLPNDSDDLRGRLDQLTLAIKLVYASPYFQNPKEFSRRVGNRTEEEKMGVMIQPVCGSRYDGFFYPVISGVAQSYNYYPFAKMTHEDGVAVIALGLGQAVMQGERTVRFSPKNPELALQISRLDDFLHNAQYEFFALPLGGPRLELGVQEAATLTKRHVVDARNEYAVKLMSSTYVPEENRLRDGSAEQGYPVVTFAQVLKYGLLPLGEMISDLLAIGQQGMGCPVEIEFSVNIPPGGEKPAEFCILQIRPMGAREEVGRVEISTHEAQRSFLFSTRALGNSVNESIRDIIFVDPCTFALEATPRIAVEVGEINKILVNEDRKYLLIGPGRWGSADRWLGIPVQWRDISGVGAIVEAEFEELRAEPSQGSHFFHNITSLGINYITIRRESGDHIDWDFLMAQPVVNRTGYLCHVSLDEPMMLKVDGRTGHCAAYLTDGHPHKPGFTRTSEGTDIPHTNKHEVRNFLLKSNSLARVLAVDPD